MFNEDGMDISNRDFWFQYKRNDRLRWIAKFFLGRPPTQCEDERHFTRTGITVSPRRARLYPETVEKNFILAKIIEFFGFLLYPEMSLMTAHLTKFSRIGNQDSHSQFSREECMRSGKCSKFPQVCLCTLFTFCRDI